MIYKKKFFSVFVFILLISFAIYLSFKSVEMAIDRQNVYLNNGSIDMADYDIYNNLIKIKGDWNISHNYDENNKSYITYNATIKKPANFSFIGMKVPTVIGYYEIFINNDKITPLNHFSYRDSDFFNVSKYYFFKSEQDYFEININFFVHNSKKPYISGDIVIGLESNIYIYNQISVIILILGCTILVLFSIILFFIYLATITNERLIFLSIFSILIFIKLLFLYTNFTRYPGLDLDDIYNFKLIASISLLSTFSLYLYFVNVFISNIYRFINYSITTFVVGSILYIILSKNNIFIITTTISYLIYFLILIFSIIALLKHKKDSVLNFIFAICLILSIVINAQKHCLFLHIDFVSIIFIMIFIFTFATKQLISNKKNLLLKYNLEKEVKLRTIDLIQKNLDLDKEKNARLIAEENLKNISNYDVQTDLFNYTYALTYIRDLINIFERYNHVFSIMIIEVNNLDFIYETFGFELKETILNETIRIIRLVIRRTDLFTSWHDDKFLIIIPNGTRKSSINIVTKLMQLIENNLIDGYGSITINYGIATIEQKDITESIINRAEYELKNNFKIKG